MPRQQATIELVGKKFEVFFERTPADPTTGIGEGLNIQGVYLYTVGTQSEDCFELFEKLDIWKHLEDAIWKQLEGDLT